MNQTAVIKRETVQAIVDYLATRPFGEVYKLVPLLLNLPEGTEVTAPKQEEPTAQQ